MSSFVSGFLGRATSPRSACYWESSSPFYVAAQWRSGIPSCGAATAHPSPAHRHCCCHVGSITNNGAVNTHRVFGWAHVLPFLGQTPRSGTAGPNSVRRGRVALQGSCTLLLAQCQRRRGLRLLHRPQRQSLGLPSVQWWAGAGCQEFTSPYRRAAEHLPVRFLATQVSSLVNWDSSRLPILKSCSVLLVGECYVHSGYRSFIGCTFHSHFLQGWGLLFRVLKSDF